MARAHAPSVGLALLLAAACGGKSVAVSDDDAGAGGTSGSGASSGGASSGGASSGGASSGGGLAGTAGGPTQPMSDAACASICKKGTAAQCFEQDDCSSSCSAFMRMANHSAACARITYNYLLCVDGLADVCSVADNDSSCLAGADASTQCIVAYCQSNPSDSDCSGAL